MAKKLPADTIKLLEGLFTLIGESLIDNRVENRRDFERAQKQIGKLMARYEVPNFECFKK